MKSGIIFLQEKFNEIELRRGVEMKKGDFSIVVALLLGVGTCCVLVICLVFMAIKWRSILSFLPVGGVVFGMYVMASLLKGAVDIIRGKI